MDPETETYKRWHKDSILKEIANLDHRHFLRDLCDPNQKIYELPACSCNRSLGFFSEETPIKLVRAVISRALNQTAEDNLNIDAILINGDFVKHGVALDGNVSDSQMEQTWAEIQDNMRASLTLIRSIFLDQPVLPVIGNNDVIMHD